jgi:hypothetical protein
MMHVRTVPAQGFVGVALVLFVLSTTPDEQCRHALHCDPPPPPLATQPIGDGTFAAKRRDVHMAPLRSEILLNIDVC